MRRFILPLLFSALLIACGKEKIPTALNNMTAFNTNNFEVYTGLGDNTVITDEGYFFINLSSKGERLLRFDLNGAPYGKNMVVFNPNNLIGSFDNKNILFHEGYIYYAIDDSIYMYETGTTDFVNPKRTIYLEGVEAINRFDIEGTKLYASSINTRDIFVGDLTGIDSVKYDTVAFSADYLEGQPLYEYPSPFDYHNGYLFMESDVGLSIIDMTDATNPVVILTLGGGASTEFLIDGNYLYLEANLVHGNNLQWYDISDPTNPILISALPYNSQGEMLIVPSRNELYVQQDEKIRVFDISDPANFHKKDVLSINGLFYNNVVGDMDVRGDYLYLTSASEFPSGIVVFDLP